MHLLRKSTSEAEQSSTDSKLILVAEDQNSGVVCVYESNRQRFCKMRLTRAVCEMYGGGSHYAALPKPSPREARGFPFPFGSFGKVFHRCTTRSRMCARSSDPSSRNPVSSSRWQNSGIKESV